MGKLHVPLGWISRRLLCRLILVYASINNFVKREGSAGKSMTVLSQSSIVNTRLSQESARLYAEWIAGVEQSLGIVDKQITAGSAGDQDVVAQVTAIMRQIRNCVIGNDLLKACFAELRIVPLMATVLSVPVHITIAHGLSEWHRHALVIIGSLAKGTSCPDRVNTVPSQLARDMSTDSRTQSELLGVGNPS